MRLNPDCIRDILLIVEKNSTFDEYVSFPNDFSSLQKYTSDEIAYHIRQCDLVGLIYGVKWLISGECIISDLSPAGHEFLANIRNDTNWNKTKEIAKKIGSHSLSALCEIASKVISDLIGKYISGTNIQL